MHSFKILNKMIIHENNLFFIHLNPRNDNLSNVNI
jgi:hypothetical protein